MRKVILWMQKAVDGYVEGPNGEFDWPVVLPEMNRFFITKQTAGAFLRADLVDEFHLFTHPVVLGGGRPLFSPLERRLPVRLVEATTFEPGVVLLRHERVR